jgi:NADH-quinone oxidoreductase subunit J
MMPLFAVSLNDVSAEVQLLLAALLGGAGVYFMLPRPRGQMTWLGAFLALAALAVGGTYLFKNYGQPSRDLVGQVLFWIFSAGALIAGTILITQRNPARGAIAFAIVILSSCGLFLLLAAPFLMAATIVVYAGAIIVTFLFVLMLSHANGPSDENDRSRDPLLGSLGGFAFLGLVLFSLYLSSPVSDAGQKAPAALSGPISNDDFANLQSAAEELAKLQNVTDAKELVEPIKSVRQKLAKVVGYAPGETISASESRAISVQDRLAKAATDARTWAIISQAQQLRDLKKSTLEKAENLVLEGGKPESLKADFAKLREQTILLSGRGMLPARNVTAIGMSLYSEHLIAVEMAGTLLLIATIGAVAIAQRKGPKS